MWICILKRKLNDSDVSAKCFEYGRLQAIHNMNQKNFKMLTLSLMN